MHPGPSSAEKGMCSGERGKRPAWNQFYHNPPGGVPPPSQGIFSRSDMAPLHSGHATLGSRHRQNENALLLIAVMGLCAVTFFPSLSITFVCTQYLTSEFLFAYKCVYSFNSTYTFSGNNLLRFQLRAFMLRPRI